MHPIICQIGPFTFYSYGLMLAIAFIVSTFLFTLRAKKDNIHPDLIFNFSFLVFIFGILGARLFYVIENISYYFKQPLEALMLWYGGLSWYGGLTAAIIAGVAYLKIKQLKPLKVFDLIVPFVALAQAIGRIGCLLNGCCFGKASEFGLYFPVHRQVLIPIQLYYSLILILIYLILRYLQEKPHREGELFFKYLLLYSAMRFLIEFSRADNVIIAWGLTLFQIISFAVFLLSFCVLLLSGAPRS